MIKFQIRIRNGYFLDENIRLSLPVVNTEIVCCKKYFLKSQNFSISFNNDQDNDRIEVRSKVKLRVHQCRKESDPTYNDSEME